MSALDISNTDHFGSILLNDSPYWNSSFHYNVEIPRQNPIIKEQFKLLFDKEIRSAFPDLAGFKVFIHTKDTSIMVISWIMKSKINEDLLNEIIMRKIPLPKTNCDWRLDYGLKAILHPGKHVQVAYDPQAFYHPNHWILQYSREIYSKPFFQEESRKHILKAASDLPDSTYIRTLFQSHDLSRPELIIPRCFEVEEVVPKSHSIQYWRMMCSSLAFERKQKKGQLDLVEISLVRGEDYHRIVLKFLHDTPTAIINEARDTVASLSSFLQNLGPDVGFRVDEILESDSDNISSDDSNVEDTKLPVKVTNEIKFALPEHGEGSLMTVLEDEELVELNDDLIDLDGITVETSSRSRASTDLIGITVTVTETDPQPRLSNDLIDMDNITLEVVEPLNAASESSASEDDGLGDIIPEVEEMESDEEGLEAFKGLGALIEELENMTLEKIEQKWEIAIIQAGKMSKQQIRQSRYCNRGRWVASAALLLRAHLTDDKPFTLVAKQGPLLLMPKGEVEVFHKSAFSLENFLARVFDAGLRKEPSEHHLQSTPNQYIYRLNN